MTSRLQGLFTFPAHSQTFKPTPASFRCTNSQPSHSTNRKCWRISSKFSPATWKCHQTNAEGHMPTSKWHTLLVDSGVPWEKVNKPMNLNVMVTQLIIRLNLVWFYSKVLLQVPELQSSTLQNYRTRIVALREVNISYRRDLSISLQQGDGSMSDKNLVIDFSIPGEVQGDVTLKDKQFWLVQFFWSMVLWLLETTMTCHISRRLVVWLKSLAMLLLMHGNVNKNTGKSWFSTTLSTLSHALTTFHLAVTFLDGQCVSGFM